MSAPKLKNLTIVDQIKERIGKTNFVDVSKLSNAPQEMTPEEVIEDQKMQIESFKKSLSWAEKALETATKEEEVEELVASIIFNKEMIENSNSYINYLKNDTGQQQSRD